MPTCGSIIPVLLKHTVILSLNELHTQEKKNIYIYIYTHIHTYIGNAQFVNVLFQCQHSLATAGQSVIFVR